MGIFATEVSIWTTYHVALAFRDKLMGGVPKDPKMMEAWLRKNMGLSDKSEELRQVMLRTLAESGLEVSEGMSWEEIETLTKDLAGVKHTNGFKLDRPAGLYVEGRCVKAMIKESTNVLFAGEKWGRTSKGPKNFVAERVFVDPDVIPLGVQEPSGVELFIGHTSGPKGPQSNLTYHEYVERPRIEFTLKVLRDELTRAQWAMLWTHAEDNGFGALRSQGFGRFDVTAWEKAET